MTGFAFSALLLSSSFLARKKFFGEMREYRRNDSESALRSGNVLCLLSRYIGETCNLLLAWSFQVEAFHGAFFSFAHKSSVIKIES